MLASIILGLLAYSGMNKELNPDVSFGIVSVLTSYPGASPDEVNTLVTKPVEDAISGVEGIQQLSSVSQQGNSIVTINFNLDVNIDNALNDVRSKIDQALPNLPKEVNKPVVTKIDTSSQPVLYMAFSATGANSEELRDLIDQKLSDRFSQVEGVAQVGVQGGDVREIQVQLNKDKLSAYGIGITDVQKALANATVNEPAGHITTDNQQLNVRLFGEFQSVDQIRNLHFTIQDPNNPQAKGSIVRLGDIANVNDTVQERTAFSRVNGQDSILVTVQKSKDGNTVDVVNGCKSIIKDLINQYKDIGLKIVITQDQSQQILDSLSDLNFTLVFGIFLVAAVVYVFLHNFRGMLIVSIAIPICLFISIITVKLAGNTINNLTMLGLQLAVAVLVDDAIVIIENIYRHLQLGEDPRDAAINGRSELGLAAIAITLNDVVVFGPIGVSGGIVGRFLFPLCLAYVAAVATSLFVSFTVTPMLASRWYRRGEEFEHPKGLFARAFEKGMAKLVNGYKRGLEWALRHRWFVFTLGNVALVAVFIFIGGSSATTMSGAVGSGFGMIKPAIFIGIITVICNLVFYRRFKPMLVVYAVLFALIFPLAAGAGFLARQWKGQTIFTFQFFPPSDTGILNLNVQLPPNANLTETTSVVKYLEGVVQKDGDVKFVNTTVGSQGVGSFSAGHQGPNYAALSVTLYDQASAMDTLEFWNKPTEHIRQRSTDQVGADLLKQIGRVPGATVTVAPGSSFGGSAIQLGFTSNDRTLLSDTVTNIYNKLKGGAVKGLENLDLSSKPGTPELRAIPNRTALSDYGLSVQDIGNALSILYQGDDTVKYREDEQQYTVRTMMSYQDRNNPDVLSQVPIKFVQGQPIYLPSVAQIVHATQLSEIDRYNRQELIQINADLLPSYSTQAGTVQSEINNYLTKNHLIPAGVTYTPLGQAKFQSQEQMGIVIAFLLGLILVYMILASLYDNILYPFIIQLAQPQAFTGAIIALMVTSEPLSLISIIGIVALVGLVAKNAILLVDYANTLRGHGKDRHDALVESGATRLRPILMTSIALILGLLPIAVALGRGSEFRQSIGTVIIGGVALSTLLTLFIIPCSYTIFDDLSDAVGRVMKRFSKRDDPSGPGGSDGHAGPSGNDDAGHASSMGLTNPSEATS